MRKAQAGLSPSTGVLSPTPGPKHLATSFPNLHLRDVGTVARPYFLQLSSQVPGTDSGLMRAESETQGPRPMVALHPQGPVTHAEHPEHPSLTSLCQIQQEFSFQSRRKAVHSGSGQSTRSFNISLF